MADLEEQVARGELPATTAARRLLDLFTQDLTGPDNWSRPHFVLDSGDLDPVAP